MDGNFRSRTGASNGLRIGTANVTTLNDKVEEMVMLMEERNLQLFGMSETRRKGEGRVRVHKNFTLIYKGLENEAKHGVGLLLSEEMGNLVEQVKYVNERILSVLIKLDTTVKLGVIQVYAPQQGRPWQEKLTFYEQLQDTIDALPIQAKYIIMGDLNGHVGSDRNGIESVIGPFNVGDRNPEGELIIDMCLTNSLSIMNTFYMHRESHKWTWYRWCREQQRYRDKSVIDYFISSDRNLFNDVKVIPSVSLDSDHRLLIAKIKLKKPVKSKTTKRKRLKIEELQIIENVDRFTREVQLRKPQDDRGERAVEEEWREFKVSITEIAETVLGTKKMGVRRKETPWWTEQVKAAVLAKNKLYRQWLKQRTEHSRLEYISARNEAERIKRQAKRDKWEDLARDMENDLLGTKKLIYSIANSYRSSSKQNAGTIKDSEGELITEPEGVDNRWKEYFEQLLNAGEEEHPIEFRREEQEATWNIQEGEVKRAIQQMKNGKSPGIDGLPAELFKNAGQDMMKWIHRLMANAWTQETIPDEWGRAIITPVFKKGDHQKCENYRGISLLCHIFKAYERILETRLRAVVEDKLSNSQYGFRPGRGTTDAIFIIKMMVEKGWEWNRPLYLAFLDLKKAFDRVPRSKLWNVLDDPYYGVPLKLKKNIKAMYQVSKSSVISQKGNELWFEVSSGVRQGSVLSPLLFILVMDSVIRSVENEDLGLVYADDIAQTSWEEDRLRDAVINWYESLRDHGMELNIEKSELLTVSRQETNYNIMVQGVNLPQATSVKYLGVNIDNEGRMELEITARIKNYSNNVFLLYPLLRDRRIPQKAKTLIYTGILRPMMLYASETWSTTTKTRSRLNAAEMRVLRLIYGVTLRDRVRSEHIREQLRIAPVTKIIERNQLRWFGHVMRMPEHSEVKRALTWTPEGPRPLGRPRKRWLDNIKEALISRGTTIEEVERTRVYNDRSVWRGLVSTG